MIPGPSQQEATMHPQDVPATQAIRVRPDAGPTQPPSSTPRTGLFEGQVWRYELSARGGLALGVLGLDLEPAQTGEVLELAVYPEMALDDDGVPDRASTRLGLVERGRPGTVLLDQEGHDLTVPARDLAAHLAATALVPEQWNLWRVDLAALAGRDLGGLALVSQADHGTGWLQLRRRLLSQGDDGAAGLVDLVDTRRGSHSGVGFSRGNTFPATCVPHGMSFLTPLTDARTLGWLHRWHGDPRPRLQGVALSHQPSPWIGERGALQVMPFAGEPVLDPEQRALGFSHDDEVAHPDYYAVALDGGIRVEMTPTSRTAALRVHLPADGGITLDQPAHGELRLSRGLAGARPSSATDAVGGAESGSGGESGSGTGAGQSGDAASVLCFEGWAGGNEGLPSQPAPVRVFVVGQVEGAVGWLPAREADGSARPRPPTCSCLPAPTRSA